MRNQFDGDDATNPSHSAPTHYRNPTVNGNSLDPPSSGPTPKRSRPSNGPESTNADAMQLDQNGFDYGNRHPPEPISPGGYSIAEYGQANGMDVDEEADTEATGQDALPVPTLTDGQSVGIQSDRVHDLGPHTDILTVPEDENIMHTTWNPRNPTILATGGDALCRIWSDIKAATFAENFRNESFYDLELRPESSLVTAMAWEPTGKLLAVACRTDGSDWAGAVGTWTIDGKGRDDFTAGPEMVIKLRWNDNGKLLLGLTSNGNGGSSLIVWEIDSSQAFSPIPCDRVLTDATWTGDGNIAVCGQGVVGRCDISSGLELTWCFGKDERITNGRWSHICHDHILGITVVADEENHHLVFLDAHGGMNAKDAHAEAITGIAYQPLVHAESLSWPTPRLLVTCSLDGSIKYWDTRTARLMHTLTFGRDPAPLAIAFSPDGVLLAVAGYNKVLIWNTVEGSVPKASWKGELGRTPKTMLTNGNGADRDSGIGDDDDGIGDPNCSLGWDAEGKKVALGMGNQVRFDNPPWVKAAC